MRASMSSSSASSRREALLGALAGVDLAPGELPFPPHVLAGLAQGDEHLARRAPAGPRSPSARPAPHGSGSSTRKVVPAAAGLEIGWSRPAPARCRRPMDRPSPSWALVLTNGLEQPRARPPPRCPPPSSRTETSTRPGCARQQAGLQAQLAARGHGLGGVLDQVQEHLLEPVPVGLPAAGPGGPGPSCRRMRELSHSGSREILAQVGQQGVEVHRLPGRRAGGRKSWPARR